MDFLGGLWDGIAEAVFKVLPMSPFTKFLEYFEDLPYLGILNWFLPIRDMLIVFATYLSAVAVYYLYSIALRWIKALE